MAYSHTNICLYTARKYCFKKRIICRLDALRLHYLYAGGPICNSMPATNSVSINRNVNCYSASDPDERPSAGD